jgi:hypothetical protein
MILVYEQDRALAAEVERELRQAGFGVRLLDTWLGLGDLARTLKARAVLFQLHANSQVWVAQTWGSLREIGIPLVATGTRGRIYRAFLAILPPLARQGAHRFRGLERPFTPAAARDALEAAIRETGPPSRSYQRWRRTALLALLLGGALLLVCGVPVVLASFQGLRGGALSAPPNWSMAGWGLGMTASWAAPRVLARRCGIKQPWWAIGSGLLVLGLALGLIAIAVSGILR